MTSKPGSRIERPAGLFATAIGVLLVIAVIATDDRDPAPARQAVAFATSTSSTTTTTTTNATPLTSTTTTTTTAPPTTTTTAPPRVEPRATRNGTHSVPPRAGVRLTLQLERTSFSAGETISGTITMVNESSENVSVDRNKCPPSHSGLYRDGNWVSGWSPGCPGVARPPRTVGPGETYEDTVSFEAYGPASDDGERAPLPPGLYQAAAGFYVFEHEDPPYEAWFAPAVDVEIR